MIIFDFDGVLADSFNAFYPLIRDAMNYAGLSLTQVQYRNFYIGNVHQSFQDFINNDKKYKIFSRFRKENYDKYYYDKKYKVKLYPGATKFIKKVRKKYILTIASSGRTNNIVDLLEQNHIKNLFSLIMANSDTSKAGMIKEILDKFQAVPEETIMITDTVGDLKAAKKSGLKTVAVTWGFHSAKILKAEKPDYLANSFKMLYKNIKAF